MELKRGIIEHIQGKNPKKLSKKEEQLLYKELRDCGIDIYGLSWDHLINKLVLIMESSEEFNPLWPHVRKMKKRNEKNQDWFTYTKNITKSIVKYVW